MHKGTVEVYEERGIDWATGARRPVRRHDAKALGEEVPQGALRVDLGCGAGRYTDQLGQPVIGFDAARSMLELCRAKAPDAMYLQGDLEALPFAAGGLHGGWANMSYVHVPRVRLPMALAELHRALAVGSPLDMQVLLGDYETETLPDDEVGGRFFCAWDPGSLHDVLDGAGFDVENIATENDVVRVRARRVRTLPDFVGAGMRMLLVGLNPSLFAADAGVGFARPGNRFWPAATAAGLLERDRDPRDALVSCRVGMTDLVKRASANARGLTREEYTRGLERVERLVHWLEPTMICMVGLAGWRAAAEPRAVCGLQRLRLGGRPVYVMPSTSGANAHVKLSELVNHLREAASLSDEVQREPRVSGTA